MPTEAHGWGTEAADQPLKPMQFERRDLRPDDVAIKITYAGVCHSDLHQCRNDWHNSRYPVVPGHEIIGTVTDIGPEVTRHKVGDTVAVGTIVDSDLTCEECLNGWEQFCLSGSTFTYNGVDKIDGSDHQGRLFRPYRGAGNISFSRCPKVSIPARASPLLCAGITTWSPLRQYADKVGTRPEGRGRRTWRAWPFGRQVRRRARRPRHHDHDFAGKGRGRTGPRRA